jgi:hypothetical protein
MGMEQLLAGRASISKSLGDDNPGLAFGWYQMRDSAAACNSEKPELPG